EVISRIRAQATTPTEAGGLLRNGYTSTKNKISTPEFFARGKKLERTRLMFRNKFFFGASLIVLAALLAYWPAVHGEFFSDDTGYLTDNPLMRAGDGLHRFWFT